MKTFTERVIDIVKSIPAGSVLTYKQVAERAGNEQSSRAVGSIMRKNYVNTIPCHRVIRSDGKIGNYNRGGENIKLQKLLAEGYTPEK